MFKQLADTSGIIVSVGRCSCVEKLYSLRFEVMVLLFCSGRNSQSVVDLNPEQLVFI